MKTFTKFTLVLLTILTSGCAYRLPPTSESSVTDSITFDYDNFSRLGTLSTDNYLGSTDGGYSSVIHNYRAVYSADNELRFIQLYMKLMAYDWHFINNVSDIKGTEFNFVSIDREVRSGGAVHETFAITISKDQLKLFAKADTRLKVSGKLDSEVFTVPKVLSSAFMKSIDSRY